jgi:UDP-N-acetylmuramate: L-alanyl-gamma-D-glutamyl-meso-diaminopimelate ligase
MEWKGPPKTNGVQINIRHIHMIAVCGTAMGALACMLKELGFRVTGSDQHVYPPMSDFLRSKGISISEGFAAEHLHPAPDLVVVGNAVSRTNPEVEAMLAHGMAYCSMPQAINRFAAAGKRQVVIAGTHGKTTTSAFIAWLLYHSGLDPSFLIGGILSNFNSNYRVGQGAWMVLEGDEYDTACFDKGPKFLHYTPDIAILTSVEFDHADIFRDLAQVLQAFGAFVGRLGKHAQLIHYDADTNIPDLIHGTQCGLVRYGRRQDADWRLGGVRIDPPYTHFEVHHQGRFFGAFKTRMIGEHNLLNLLAGIAAGHRLDLDAAAIGRAVESFQGVRRRQQVRGVKNGVVVIDDFAHHPTAVKVTVQAVQSFYAPRRVIAVFEPRTNSSRRNVFQTAYAESFDPAGLICVRQPPLLEKIPEGERFSSEKLVADLRARHLNAEFFQDTDAILAFLSRAVRPGDVVLIMSNGGFDDIHARLLEQL